MRKAFIVGVNYYQHVGGLYGCVDDAYAVKGVLDRHGDGTVNFTSKFLTGTGPTDQVLRDQIRDGVEELFKGDSEVALFYFAGHGYLDAAGGTILGSDARRGDEGVSLNDILAFANQSSSRNKIIILDSCHSGIAGNSPAISPHSQLSEGLTILTASGAEQYATEDNGRGVFTTLFVDALFGGAANLTGDITPASIYAHIDQALGAWEQRPVFKTNVKEFISLRRTFPPIALADLHRLTEFFPEPGFQFQMDPTFEPELKGRDQGMPPPDKENVRKFAVLQRFNRLNLLVPVGCDHMWNAAMESKVCVLTALGEHWRRLVEKERI